MCLLLLPFEDETYLRNLELMRVLPLLVCGIAIVVLGKEGHFSVVDVVHCLGLFSSSSFSSSYFSLPLFPMLV